MIAFSLGQDWAIFTLSLCSCSSTKLLTYHSGTNSSNWTEWIHPKTQLSYELSLKSAGQLSSSELQSCFELIEETSRLDYEPSSIGWKPGKKLAEMKSAELRYILVKDNEDSICGFTSLMPTFEEGEPVVYCYEIHLKSDLQG